MGTFAFRKTGRRGAALKLRGRGNRGSGSERLISGGVLARRIADAYGADRPNWAQSQSCVVSHSSIAIGAQNRARILKIVGGGSGWWGQDCENREKARKKNLAAEERG